MTKPSKVAFAIIGILVLALAAGFVGAKASGGDSGGSAASSDVGKATWIDKIKKSGTLRVGCADAPPTTVVKSDGTCTGPDLIPLQDLAKALGVKMVTVATSDANKVAALQDNRYDVMSNLDQTVERGLSIQFTNPSWQYPGVFLLPKSANLTTSKAIIASSKPIATSAGSAQDAALQEAKLKSLRVDSFESAASAVDAKRASAVFTDIGTAVSIAQKRPGWGIVVPDPPIFVHYVGYGVPANIDARSLQIINIAIDNSVASGAIKRAFTEAGYKDVDELGDLLIKPAA